LQRQPVLPLVSIVLPSLNQMALLAAAVESVLSQSYAHIELIVVDGGSTDGTVAWLAQRQAQDARLRFITEPDNGPADATNKGLRMTRGTVVGWLDASDGLTPDAVQRAAAALLAHREWLMVYGHADHTDAGGRVVGRSDALSPTTFFFRRALLALLGPLDATLQTAARRDYCLRAVERLAGRAGMLEAVQAQCRIKDADAHFGMVVSLGSFCHAATVLRQLEWRAFTGPFDWIFSKPEVTAHALADDFKVFLDPAQFEPVPPEQRLDLASNRCDHKFYRERFGQRFLFNHHSPDQANDQAYFQRAVERFKAALVGAQPCLLLMVAQEPFHEARYRAVLDALNARGANYFLLMVNFVVRPVVDEAFDRVVTLASAPKFLALELAVSGRSDGVAFANPADTAALARVLKTFRVRTHPRPLGFPI
jgi:glycosyltransferase involved in cell wall biosynthesis